MPFYRNKETGKVQYHPKSGLGETFNAVEIEETGKPVKPYTSLAPTKAELSAAKKLMKDKSATPLDVAAAEALLQADKLSAPKTTGSKSAAGDSEQEGAS